MSFRQITPAYAVSPQITPEDLPEIRAAGFTTVICNRPDAEIPEEIHADRMRVHAEAAGLAFHVLPLTHQTMTPENVARQAALVDQSDGPVLAYCASGTRCTIVWALSQAGQMPAAEIIAKAAAAGYDISGLAGRL